jgi:hypothetical protein
MQGPLANCVPNRLFHPTRLARLDNGSHSRFVFAGRRKVHPRGRAGMEPRAIKRNGEKENLC